MKNLIVIALIGLVHNLMGQTNPNPNSAVDDYIQNEMNSERFPGVSTIIVKDGKIVWVESYGYADLANNVPVEDTTVFLLASMSKLFTGTAAMQAYEQGLLNLDRDINTYLPLNIDVPGFENDSITLRQLMTHTASIKDGNAMDAYYDHPDPTISLADCIEKYFSTTGADYNPADNFLNNAPGTAYSYSNMGTALNGFITEAASGMPFDDFCDQHIFEPLCMDKTGWHFADFDSAHVARPYQYSFGNYTPYAHYGFADYPDGQLRSNVMDLGNFMIAYLNGGTFGSQAILVATSINMMWTPQVPALSPEQGLNWYQQELFYDGGSSVLWGHNGGEDGVSTDMYLDPQNKIGICVLTNGEGDALNICDELYDYARSIPTVIAIDPTCGEVTTVETLNTENPEILKVIDFLGREIDFRPNIPCIILYTDGSAKRMMQVDFR